MYLILDVMKLGDELPIKPSLNSEALNRVDYRGPAHVSFSPKEFLTDSDAEARPLRITIICLISRIQSHMML